MFSISREQFADGLGRRIVSSSFTGLAICLDQELKREKEEAAAAFKLQEEKAEEKLQFQLKQQVNECDLGE